MIGLGAGVVGGLLLAAPLVIYDERTVQRADDLHPLTPTDPPEMPH